MYLEEMKQAQTQNINAVYSVLAQIRDHLDLDGDADEMSILTAVSGHFDKAVQDNKNGPEAIKGYTEAHGAYAVALVRALKEVKENPWPNFDKAYLTKYAMYLGDNCRKELFSMNKNY